MRLILISLWLAAAPAFAGLPDGTHLLFRSNSVKPPHEVRLYRWVANTDSTTTGHFDLAMVGTFAHGIYSPMLLREGNSYVLLARGHSTTTGLVRFQSGPNGATPVAGTEVPFASYSTPEAFSTSEGILWEDSGASLVDTAGKIRPIFKTEGLIPGYFIRFQRLDDDHLVALAALGQGNFDVTLLKLTESGPVVIERRSVALNGYSIQGFRFGGFEQLWGFSLPIRDARRDQMDFLGMRPKPDPYQLFQSSAGMEPRNHGDASPTYGEVLAVNAEGATIRRGWKFTQFHKTTSETRDLAAHPSLPVDRADYDLLDVWFPEGDFFETPWDEAHLGPAFRLWKGKFLADWQRHQAQARRPVDTKLPARIPLLDLRMMDSNMADSLTTMKHVPATKLADYGLRLDRHLLEPLPEKKFADIAVSDLAKLATSCAITVASQAGGFL